MTKHFYIKISILFFFLLWLKVDLYAQTVLSSTEEVCIEEIRTYRVEGSFDSEIYWEVTGGIILNDDVPQGDSFGETTVLEGTVYQSVIQVKWGNVPGEYQLRAHEETPEACVSGDLVLDVTVKALPDLSALDFSVTSLVCHNNSPVLTVTGLSPSVNYTVEYNDNGTMKTQSVTTNTLGSAALDVDPITADATYNIEKISFNDGTSNCAVTPSPALAAKTALIDNVSPSLSGCLSSTEVWNEDFNAYTNNTSSATNNGVSWTGLALTGFDRIRVLNGRIEAYVQDLATREWTTSSMDISSASPIVISFNAEAWASNDAGNSIDFQYRLNGSGEFVSFKKLTGSFAAQLVTSPSISGNSVELRVVVARASGTAVYYFDEVKVKSVVEREADTEGCTYAIQGSEFDVTASDNCGVNSLTYTLSGATSGTGHNLGSILLNKGLTEIRWTATDESSNNTSCSFNVLVADNTAPVPDLADLASVTAQCEVTDLTSPTATDNCGGIVTGVHNASLPITTQGTTLVTWTYTDAEGNTSTQTQDVVIDDTTPPVINNMPGDIVVTSCNQVINWTEPTATDNCGRLVMLTSTHSSGSIFPEGETTVTYTANDGVNTVEESFTITVQDGGEAPLICFEATNHALGKTTVQSSSYAGTAGGSLAVDGNRSGVWADGSISHTNSDPQAWWQVDLGSDELVDYVNIFRRTDCCPERLVNFYVLLSDVDLQSVTLSDALQDPDVEAYYVAGDPGDVKRIRTSGRTARYVKVQLSGTNYLALAEIEVMECTSQQRENITVDTDAGNCTANVSWEIPEAVDNCGEVTLTSTHSSGEAFPKGTTTVTYTATDGTNAATSDFDIIVNDNEKPIILGCPNNITVGACNNTVNWIPPTVNDNCSVTLTSTYDSGDVFNVGTTTVVYTANDGSGNTENCSFDITVLPELTIALTGNSSVSCYGETTEITITAEGGDGFYSYSKDGTNYQPESSFDLPAGMHTLYVKDGNGCIAQKDITVTEPTELSVVLASSKTTICEGEEVSFTINASGSYSNYTYVFYINGDYVNGTGDHELNATGNVMTSSSLNDGDEITIQVESSSVSGTICQYDTPVGEEVIMTVNDIASSALNITASDICFTDDGVVTIENAENGVEYSLYIDGNTTATVTETGTGDDLDLIVSAVVLDTEKTYNIMIKAKKGDCIVDMDTAVSITVEHKPLPSEINY